MRYCLLIFLFSTLFGANYAIFKDASFYPYDFREKTAEINGYLETLILEIAAKEKIGIYIENVSPLSLFNSLNNKEADAVLTTLSKNEEREKTYAFSYPILLLGPVLVVPKSSKAKCLASLQGKIVGISPFDNSSLIVQKYPSIIMKPFDNLRAGLLSLARGEIDGILMPALGVHELINSEPFENKLKVITPPLSDEAIRLVALKGEPEKIFNTFNRDIKSFAINGRLKNMQKKFNIY